MSLRRSDPIGLESFQVFFESATGISFGSSGVTNCTNVSGVGMLNVIALKMSVSSNAGVTAKIEIQIDGQTTQNIPLVTAGSLDAGFGAFLTYSTGSNFYLFPINSRFALSCRVGVNVSAAAGANFVDLSVIRGAKI